MADYDIDEIVRETQMQIEQAPICEPVDDESVDECAYSRTGWAIWRFDGSRYCTCRPAMAPAQSGSAAGGAT